MLKITYYSTLVLLLLLLKNTVIFSQYKTTKFYIHGTLKLHITRWCLENQD